MCVSNFCLIFKQGGGLVAQAVRPLICPCWDHEFDSRCRQSVNCCGQCRDFGDFSLGSSLPQFHPTIILHILTAPLHANSYSHYVFHFKASMTSFMVRKNSWLGTPPVYNLAGSWEVIKAKGGSPGELSEEPVT